MKLVNECIEYKIIISKIIIADGFFTSSWAVNLTKYKFSNPTDPETSITVHNNKYYGKGFTTIVFTAWCGDRWLLVWFKTYTGNIGENKTYIEVVSEFLKDLPYDWKIIEYGRGADYHENRVFNRENGLISIIAARKNIKYDHLIELRKGKYYLESDIPELMGTFKFARLSDHRAQGEFLFSIISNYFNMKNLNSMGLDFASIHIYKALILMLSKAITAFKMNRPDLIMDASASKSIYL